MIVHEPAIESSGDTGHVWDRPWPDGELDNHANCPVCGEGERAMMHECLVDNVFHCAPGTWTAWECAGCRSGYLDPRPSEASIHLAYGSYYTHHEAVGREPYASLSPARKLRRRMVNGYLNWRFEADAAPASPIGASLARLVPALRDKLDSDHRHLPTLPPSGGALLDVGCGSGGFLEVARSLGWSVTGVDPDPAAVAACTVLGLDVQQGFVDQLQGQNRTFDVITLSHVIEHVHDPLGLLSSCYELLKPGGTIWVETPNVASLGHALYGTSWRGLETPRHLVLFSGESLERALASAGFERVRQLNRPNPARFMFACSERIRRGLDPHRDAPLSAGLRAKVLLANVIAGIARGRSEFITMNARKPCPANEQ